MNHNALACVFNCSTFKPLIGVSVRGWSSSRRNRLTAIVRARTRADRWPRWRISVPIVPTTRYYNGYDQYSLHAHHTHRRHNALMSRLPARLYETARHCATLSSTTPKSISESNARARYVRGNTLASIFNPYLRATMPRFCVIMMYFLRVAHTELHDTRRTTPPLITRVYCVTLWRMSSHASL